MTTEAPRKWLGEIYRHLPNIVSMLGVVPLSLLLLEDGFTYFPALVIYNNVMDDLDGILARKLDLTSDFGARLDNVADAVSHILIALVVGGHYGGIVLAASGVAAAAILVRVVQRLAPSPVSGIGTPTNELMRHLLLLVVVQNAFDVNITSYLVAAFLLNSVSMLVPFSMPHLIRARANSTASVAGVNVALAAAWGASVITPFVAAAFFGTYLYSLAVSGSAWIRGQPST